MACALAIIEHPRRRCPVSACQCAKGWRTLAVVKHPRRSPHPRLLRSSRVAHLRDHRAPPSLPPRLWLSRLVARARRHRVPPPPPPRPQLYHRVAHAHRSRAARHNSAGPAVAEPLSASEWRALAAIEPPRRHRPGPGCAAWWCPLAVVEQPRHSQGWQGRGGFVDPRPVTSDLGRNQRPATPSNPAAQPGQDICQMPCPNI